MNPTVEIALALIIRDARILVARRTHGPLSGKWEFPGGKIEAGESIESAAVRECDEELGVPVRPLENLGVVEHTYPELTVRLNLVVCELPPGAIPRALASETVAWAALDELGGWDIPEPNHRILERLRERLSLPPG